MNLNRFLFPTDGSKSLSDFSTNYVEPEMSSDDAKKDMKKLIKRMREQQTRLYAGDQRSLLIIFQAMDAAGKDGTIKHVMSGINPQGCKVTSFKKPSEEELDHDFLWRCYKEFPRKGNIGIFNRSYYEEVLVVRVHPQILQYQKLIGMDGSNPGKEFWNMRMKAINNMEKFTVTNNTTILKFFLHVSKEEQKERFMARIDNPQKNWKFNAGDVEERAYWNDYQFAYNEMLLHTSTEYAPWYVIPADHKWFMRRVVSEIITEKMESLDLQYPRVGAEQMEEIRKAAIALENEK